MPAPQTSAKGNISGEVHPLPERRRPEKLKVEPFDEKYWGPGGIDLSRWGRGEVCRGARYKDLGPTTDGAANQRRSISSGRKSRGSSANDLEKSVVRAS